jgi:LysM repeat protein/predicted chitinase
MSYTVRSGDTLSGIAARNHVSLAELERANPQVHNANSIYVGEQLNIPGRSDGFQTQGSAYFVKPGDSMGGIAAHFGVSLAALEQANPQVSNPNNIQIGQRLTIPGHGGGAPAPTPAPAPSSGGGGYTVSSGDSMSGIAARFGISLAALEQANPQVTNPNSIYVGQHLNIPGHGGGAPAPAPGPSSGGGYTVSSGDSMSGIAARFGISLAALEQANPQVTNPNSIYVGQHLNIPGHGGGPAPAPGPSSGGGYTVQSGDSMSGIAARFGISLGALEQANPQVANPNNIYVGEHLNIPGGTGPGPTPGPTPSPGPAPQGFHPLTPAEFRAIAPNLGSKADLYTPYLNQAMVRFGITTPQREAAFLAQITEETAGFDTLTEYASGAEYEGRADLGNIYPGDGRRYKGRGAIQLTGRANYANYGAKLGLDLVNHPEIAADPSVAFLIAGQYWSDHGLNQLADQGDFIDITRRINGGTNGEASREYYWSVARRELGI